MGKAYEPRSGCPINATIEVFGDRWSLLVLRDIVFGDRRYFRKLQASSEEGIASIFSPTGSSDSSSWA
jgi:DNA-binding HxlR family transcriptional regulator